MTDLAAVLLHRATAHRHARLRAVERLGVYLDDDAVREHESAIRRGRSTLLGSGWQGRDLHAVDEQFLAVWCPRIRAIVTYLEHPSQWRGSLYGRGM